MDDKRDIQAGNRKCYGSEEELDKGSANTFEQVIGCPGNGLSEAEPRSFSPWVLGVDIQFHTIYSLFLETGLQSSTYLNSDILDIWNVADTDTVKYNHVFLQKNTFLLDDEKLEKLHKVPHLCIMLFVF